MVSYNFARKNKTQKTLQHENFQIYGNLFCIALFCADCEVDIYNFRRDITETESCVFL